VIEHFPLKVIARQIEKANLKLLIERHSVYLSLTGQPFWFINLLLTKVAKLADLEPLFSLYDPDSLALVKGEHPPETHLFRLLLIK